MGRGAGVGDEVGEGSERAGGASSDGGLARLPVRGGLGAGEHDTSPINASTHAQTGALRL